MNHIWQKDYLKLQAENVKVRAQVTMLEKQIKEVVNRNQSLEAEIDRFSNKSEASSECENTNLTPDDVEAIKQQVNLVLFTN